MFSQQHLLPSRTVPRWISSWLDINNNGLLQQPTIKDRSNQSLIKKSKFFSVQLVFICVSMLPRLGSWIFHMCSFLSSLRENNRLRSMYPPKFILDSFFHSLSLTRSSSMHILVNKRLRFSFDLANASDLEYLCLCASCSRICHRQPSNKCVQWSNVFPNSYRSTDSHRLLPKPFV